MAFEFTKIDDNLSDEEFIIEYRKQNYRELELLSEEQIDELISTQDLKKDHKKIKFVYLALEQKKLKNRSSQFNGKYLILYVLCCIVDGDLHLQKTYRYICNEKFEILKITINIFEGEYALSKEKNLVLSCSPETVNNVLNI